MTEMDGFDLGARMVGPVYAHVGLRVFDRLGDRVEWRVRARSGVRTEDDVVDDVRWQVLNWMGDGLQANERRG